MQAVQEAQPEARRARSLTRTAISRLRVDTLRSLLDQLGADSRGNKDALVQVMAHAGGAGGCREGCRGCALADTLARCLHAIAPGVCWCRTGRLRICCLPS